MKNQSYLRFLVFIFLTVSFILGCGGPKNTIPLKDNDYLTYQQISGLPELDYTYYEMYYVDFIRSNRFRITWVTLANGIREGAAEMVIDSSGKILKIFRADKSKDILAKNFWLKRQIGIWLPPNKRRKNRKVFLSGVARANIVTEERKWKKWDVWVTKYEDTFNTMECYFDKKTGLLVGKDDLKGKVYMLIDTSVDIEF